MHVTFAEQTKPKGHEDACFINQSYKQVSQICALKFLSYRKGGQLITPLYFLVSNQASINSLNPKESHLYPSLWDQPLAAKARQGERKKKIQLAFLVNQNEPFHRLRTKVKN